MARLPRNKDHALLGHAPRDTFVSADASPCPPYGNSGVDFSDVFGGPPRRSSVGHTRPGLVEPAGGSGGCVGEEAAEPRRPWSSSLGEKPVFGVIGSPSRRRRAGDGFFDDVFRAPEPVLSSNAVLSPARLLPPSRDSALPAQLSLSTRPFKGSDYPAYGSHAPDVTQRNEKSMSDVFSTSPVYNAPSSYRRLLQTKDNPKRDTRASFNERTLLHRTLHSQYRLLDATGLAGIETNDTESQLKKDTCGPQAYSDHGYFHFSMYKWASIGVTLVRPHNLKERTKSGTKVSRISIKVSKSADCPIGNQRMSEGHEIFHNQCELEDKSQLSGLAAEEYHDIKLTKEMKKIVPASSDTKDIQSDLTDKSDSAETKLNLPMSALDDIDTCSKDGASVPVKAWKPEPRNLPQLLNVYSDKEGDRERIGKRRNKESVVVGYITKMNDANDPANLEQTISKTGKSVKEIHDTLAAWEDKMVGSRVKGKVRDFVKIFNLEPAPKSGSTIENQDRRPITRNETEGRLVDNEALSTPLMRANQNLGIGERPASDRVLSMQKMDDSSSEVKGILSDRIPNTLDTSFCKIEEAYIENIDECLVEELCHNQNEMTEADTQQDEIKKSDAKIREWSKGKEGNIRSLLSTLQYVLWPGSGWKPVPLVDIVEGTSVRRAYQKALLCLHPDKLQQKGAEMHKKYIAEKIFNILQEAWIHFNSVSSL